MTLDEQGTREMVGVDGLEFDDASELESYGKLRSTLAKLQACERALEDIDIHAMTGGYDYAAFARYELFQAILAIEDEMSLYSEAPCAD